MRLTGFLSRHGLSIAALRGRGGDAWGVDIAGGGVVERVTVFLASPKRPHRTPRSKVERWWDGGGMGFTPRYPELVLGGGAP